MKRNSKMRRWFALFMGVIMALNMMLGLPVTKRAYAAEAAATPSYTKSITNDGQVADSYTISLDVTGKDQKTTSSETTTTKAPTDVVLVIDMSYSMYDKDGTATDYYGNPSTKSYALSKALVSKSGWSVDGGLLYDLLNDSSNDMRFAVVSFSDTATTQTGFTTDLDTLYSAVWACNGQYGNETDTEAGLAQAQTVLANARADANKAVIFITDGDPNYVNRSQTDFNTAANATYAKAEAMAGSVDSFYALSYNYKGGDPDTFLNTLAGKFATSGVYKSSGINAVKTALQDAANKASTKTTETVTPMTGVSITDTLSQYVKLNGTPSVSVTSGTDADFDSSKVTISKDGDEKVIKADFGNYALKDGVTYTLQIPVVPSQTAQDEADKADADISKFPSNGSASLAYSYGTSASTTDYAEKPQIAVKKADQVTVTFDSQGGSTVAAQKINKGATASEPQAPTREGYTFDRWYTSADCIHEFDFANAINADTTVYAGWKKDITPITTFDISKTLQVNGKDKTPKADFTFTLTPKDGAPAIANAVASIPSGADLTDKAYASTAAVNLSNVAWTAEGTYTYTIAEKQNDGFTAEYPQREKMEYDSSAYTLTVKVVEQDGKYVVSEMTITDKSGAKVDKAAFTNNYTYTAPTIKTTDLTVNKTVTGKNAPDGQAFSFTIQFTANDQQDGYNETAPVVKSSDDTGLTTETTLAYGTPATFTLKNGQSVTFTVPEGTTYSVTEAGVDYFTPSVTVTSGGTAQDAVTGTKSNSLTANGTAAEGANTAAFTNDYDKPENPLTGLVDKNGPFVLVSLLAVAAIAGYAVDSRRRRSNR